MRPPFEKSGLLDRGGKPTVRDLLSSLVFNPVDGTIRLNGERIIMQRAAVGSELRRELISLLGPQEARIFLMRLGFASGRADARFVRTRWPDLNIHDAFTAGTRLHTFSGAVRVETAHNEFDLRKKRFSAEFIWHDSAEVEEYLRLHQQATEPVCWNQLGYASGYASEFFDTLVIYKEVECRAEGHSHCRVIGKPAEAWGVGDPEVIVFRERIDVSSEETRPEPRRALTQRAAEQALSALDRILVAPVRDQLDRFAPMALPVLIDGEVGTGRGRAARYLHRVATAAGGKLREIAGTQVDDDVCADIARPVRGGRRAAITDAILIDRVQQVPADKQEALARAIEEGLQVGGPRVFALIALDSADKTYGSLHPSLWYALSALRVRMPSLNERPADRLPIARALLPMLAARMGRRPPDFDAGAARLIERADWPGNLLQMRSVLSAALAAHGDDAFMSAAEIEARLDCTTPATRQTGGGADGRLRQLIDRTLSAGHLSMVELENEVYRAAVARTRGNLSAAARLLGISRAQLAYRLQARTAEAERGPRNRVASAEQDETEAS